jgi:3-oxoacyl-[acyl-carrier-protein] synthase-3
METSLEGSSMITGKPFRIAGMGIYLPGAVESADLEKRYGIPAGWAQRYSGVARRHHVTTETNGYMGARAAEKAMIAAGIELGEIDMLISAGATYDYPLPNQASVIKCELKDGARYNFPAIDIDSTCLSFVAALEIAASLLDGKSKKNILIVSSETASKGLNEDIWETITLFGDGAAAAVVSYDEEGKSVLVKGMQRTYSEGVYDTIIRGGGNKYFFRDHAYDRELHSFEMKGKQLLRLAKKRIPEFMKEFHIRLHVWACICLRICTISVKDR